jgi:acetylornithine aminotransferase
MLCDEVQCGMGRTGSWFGFQASGVQPDAFSLAKALASGYPMGAVVASPKTADVLQPGKHASTFGGTPLACAAALATLEVIEEERLVEHAGTAGKTLADALAQLAGKHACVEGVRGRGLMVGLVVDRPCAELANAIIEAGLLCLATANTVIRFLPPLTVSDDDIGAAVTIVDDCLGKWNGGTKQ